MKKIIAFLFLIAVNIYATQNNAENLAKFSASGLYNLDSHSLKETIKVYLKNHPKVKALKILENGEKFLTFYLEDDKQIFYKPIPQRYLNLISYSSDIIYNGSKIGTIKIYYDDDLLGGLLTDEERAWLKKTSCLKSFKRI